MCEQAARRPLHVLSVNAGSSSLKVACYALGEGLESLLLQGRVEEIASPEGRLRLQLANHPERVEAGAFPDHQAAIDALMQRFAEHQMPAPGAAGHRVVHGGSTYLAPTRITPAVLDEIRRLSHLAPLHLPANLAGIEALSARFPRLPQVACFDTAFHGRMPEVAKRLPLSHAFWDQGLRRFGFHGLSYEYVLSELGASRGKRTIIAHLGNGASLAAVRDGKPLDTTMGFTPTGGVMMGSRSGDLDPGVLIYLMREQGYNADSLERLLNREAGLRGMSGVTSNMEVLLSRTDDACSVAAVELFVYQIRKAIGALSAVLGGLDTLVFTGGIGEHAPPIRAMVCRGLEHLGVEIDEGRNQRHDVCISTDGASCRVLVIATNEHLMIARHVKNVIRRATDRGRA